MSDALSRSVITGRKMSNYCAHIKGVPITHPPSPSSAPSATFQISSILVEKCPCHSDMYAEPRVISAGQQELITEKGVGCLNLKMLFAWLFSPVYAYRPRTSMWQVKVRKKGIPNLYTFSGTTALIITEDKAPGSRATFKRKPSMATYRYL